LRLGQVVVVLLVLILQAAPVAARSMDPAPSASAVLGDDPIATALQLFDGEQYAEGLRLLNLAARKGRRNHVEYARVLMTLARFYEQYAGDYRRVAGHLREIRRLKLPADNPDVVAAQQLQGKIDQLAAQYKSEDKLLASAKSYKKDRETLERRAAELTALIERRPDYPKLAAAYHYLGATYLQLDRYRQAHQAFEKALELKPAIGFSLPTPVQRDRAFSEWVRGDLSVAAWVVLGGLLLVAAVLFLRSRSWRHMGLRHAGVLAALLAAWWLFFRGAVWLFGRSVTGYPEALPGPVYLYKGIDSPMSQELDTLFIYGLVGVLGAFVLSVGMAQLKPRWTWAFANAAAVMVLCTSLMTQFYLRYGTATFEPAAEGRYPHLKGALYYSLTANQDPFILTDPVGHCRFLETIKEMDEPQVQRWFSRYAEQCKP
jgi:tetratricopeptide (TPR) repeat protein